MTNLRELAESDLAQTLEGEFELPVILISPDGAIQDKSANNPENDLAGQVMYETKSFNPDTGEEITVNVPVVTLRRSSLDRIPIPGEKWMVKMPKDPSLEAPLEDFIIDTSNSLRGGRSIGYIKFYLRRAEQE